MKLARFLVVPAVAALISASSASAINQVWFEVVGLTGHGGIDLNGQGAPGKGTQLTCDKTGQSGTVRCDWDILVHGELQPGLNGYSMDLFSNDASLFIKNGPPVFQPNQFAGANAAHQMTFPGPGGSLVRASEAIVGSVPGGSNNLFLFHLSLTKSAGSVGNLDLVSANNGFGWTPSPQLVQYGGNAPISGAPPYHGVPGAVPVISIRNIVPEPMTLGMLGMGALALIRRKR